MNMRHGALSIVLASLTAVATPAWPEGPANLPPEPLLRALYRGEFARARDEAKAKVTEATRLAGYAAFAEAEPAVAKGKWGAARSSFFRAESIAGFEDVARYWVCKSYAAEGRALEAQDCFAKAELDLTAIEALTAEGSEVVAERSRRPAGLRLRSLRRAKDASKRLMPRPPGLDVSTLNCDKLDCDALLVVEQPSGEVLGLLPVGAVSVDATSFDESRLIRAPLIHPFGCGTCDAADAVIKQMEQWERPQPSSTPKPSPSPSESGDATPARYVVAASKLAALERAGRVRSGRRGAAAGDIEASDLDCGARPCDAWSVILDKHFSVLGVVPAGAFTRDGRGFDRSRLVRRREALVAVRRDGAVDQFAKDFATGVDSLVNPGKYDHGLSKIDYGDTPATPTPTADPTPTAEPTTAEPQPESTQRGAGARSSNPRGLSRGITDGRRYALVVGIDRYTRISPLGSATNDARAVAAVLEAEYGFEVVTLFDAAATRDSILSALNTARKTLGDQDKFLLYYAGHGDYRPETDTSYWLPVDADASDNTKWLDARSVTDQLKLMSARQVLVIADSCFSGTMTRAATTDLRAGSTRDTYLNKLADKPSRVLIASGGNEPVSDTGGQGHSLFASVLLSALRNPFDAVFSAEELMTRHLKESVAGRSEQTPEYRVIRNSGHDGGDFVFQRR
jgi:uncharacterized caspase-like protein